MASNLLKPHYQQLQFLKVHRPNKPFKQLFLSLQVQSSISSLSTPPNSKEEAIFQAKTCLARTLEKPLNNPKLAGKLKKLRQPRIQIEIPVIDEDSPASLCQLAIDVFTQLPIQRKAGPVGFVLLWPNPTLKENGSEAFRVSSVSNVVHVDLSEVGSQESNRILNSADVAVFLAPERSQLSVVKLVSDGFYPKPVVLFNPKWGFEEESNVFVEFRSFVESFDVVYSFMGLQVNGVFSKRKGVVFKCERERWTVFVEEQNGELQVVSSFRSRPSIGEVETVLYNLMAMNSPITKSAKFLRDLVSNVYDFFSLSQSLQEGNVEESRCSYQHNHYRHQLYHRCHNHRRYHHHQ